MKLLYIDDDDIDRMAVSRMARKFPGIQFTAVDSVEAALPYFGGNDAVDIILSDFHLGIDTLPEFAHRFGHIPFFVLTGKDKIDDEPQLRRLGMIGKFSKPVVEAHLQQILDWFSGDGEGGEEDTEGEKFGQSYLEHLTQGDPAFRQILLSKLTDELEEVKEQLSYLAKHPDKHKFLLLVHQLKYKTTLVDAEYTLQWCKDLEKRFVAEVSDAEIQEAIRELGAEVDAMKTFAHSLMG